MQMAEHTSDDDWRQPKEIKVLTIEHHMAARRGGFSEFFEPLYKLSNFKTGMLDGTLNGLSYFTNQISPLIEALKSNDQFEVARIVKERSPLLQSKQQTRGASVQRELQTARNAVQSVFALWEDNADPVLLDILKNVHKTGLFATPDTFAPILCLPAQHSKSTELQSEDRPDESLLKMNAWQEALNVPYSQLKAYASYIAEESPYATHQGIKGLQFPRVMVILDDKDARGKLFNYEQLVRQGKESQDEVSTRRKAGRQESKVDATRRLLYVTCSRAQRSLAVVMYTSNPEAVINDVLHSGWFQEDEVVCELELNRTIDTATSTLKP